MNAEVEPAEPLLRAESAIWRDTDRMLKRALYVTATVVLVAGFLYAAVADPSPCRMDDASAFCGSGARWSAVVGSTLLAWVLSYIARGVNNRKS